MLGALGDVWLSDTLAFKPQPGCAYLQPALEAVLRLREEQGFEAADVGGVEVDAGLLTVGMERLCGEGELTPVRVCFSVALSTAVALTAGRFTHHEHEPGWLSAHSLELRELAARVRVGHDPELSRRTLAGAAQGLPMRAALGDIPPRAWRLVRRRTRELRMDEASLGLREIARIVGPGGLAGALRERARRSDGDAPQGIAALDTSELRMTFPSRVRVRLRGGRLVEAEGREPGACGASVAEQSEVVAAKWVLTGGRPERLEELTGITARIGDEAGLTPRAVA
jgi:hypothetical protein